MPVIESEDLNRAGRRHGAAIDPGRIAVSPREAAVALGVSVPTLYLLLDSGRIPSVKCGSRRLIAVQALHRFWRADRCPNATPPRRGPGQALNIPAVAVEPDPILAGLSDW